MLIPQFDVSWKHDFDDQSAQIEGVIFNDPGNTPISFSSDNPETDYFKTSLGVLWVFPGGNTLFAICDTTHGLEKYSDYNVSAGMRMEF